MPKNLNILIATLSLFFFAIAVISSGIGLWALAHSQTCASQLKDYVVTVTVMSAGEIAISILFGLVVFLAHKATCLSQEVGDWSYVLGNFLLVTSGIITIVCFSWGVYLLVTQEQCKNTPIFGVAVYFAVAGGLNIFRSPVLQLLYMYIFISTS